MESIEIQVTSLIHQGITRVMENAGLTPPDEEFHLEQPRNPEHGDWACNAAMKLAKSLKMNPMTIAEGIVEQIPGNNLIDQPEVARPGFINLRMSGHAVSRLISDILEAGGHYGQSNEGNGRKVLIEFVSANPTGPLHIGHCRGAVIGDVLARLFTAAGYEVSREYYYNDAGVQMEKLGLSLRARYLHALGDDVTFPEDGYQGDYMKDIARQVHESHGDSLRDECDISVFTNLATAPILKMIEHDLESLRIHFDSWFSETSLHQSGQVKDVIKRLKEHDHIYEKDGAWWLKTVDHGDEKDRVVIKSDGNYTYLTPDIAYHEYKFNRGFEKLINVMGADHHGYIPRLKAAVKALGHEAGQLDCPLVQMVSIQRDGQTDKMTTRGGVFITLKQVIEDIGPDVTRFLFLIRSLDSQMTFDFDVARDTSMDNPLYYVQYAHARCSSIRARAEGAGFPVGSFDTADLLRLNRLEEKAIVRQMDRLPHVVLQSVREVDPMPMTVYLRDLATAFHSYYSEGNRNPELRVIREDDRELAISRLALIAGLRQTLANGLKLLGIEPLHRL
jgi:arginyl-tRNA synthetase